MATSNKAQDPAAAALLAIEEALNLSQEESPAEAPKEPELSTPITPYPSVSAAEAAPAPAPPSDPDTAPRRLPEVEEYPLFAPKKPERGKMPELAGPVEFAAERGPVRPSVLPANDDRHSVGAILKALNKRPSRTPLILATIFSVLWLLLAAFYFISHRAGLLAQGPIFKRPETALYALLAFGPVIFFVVTGVLARRAQEMRLTARSMVEIAMRLAEPESIASEQMVTLSQAIRREIVSMGDGIERALARAGELETLVRSEVSNLERSYSDNERRIRALVEELSTERETMVANSERMRNAISGAQDSFSHELGAAATGLAENLNATGNRITMSLGAKAEEIRLALGDAGDDLVESLTSHGTDILNRLEQTKDSIEAGLGQVGDEISQRVNDASGRIAAVLGETTSALASQSGKINENLAQTAQASLDSFAYHSSALNDRFSETVGEAISAIATHGERVNETLTDRLARFQETVASQGNMIGDRLGDETRQLVATVGKQFEAIESVLAVQGSELDRKLESRAQHTADVFAAQTQVFEDRAGAKVEEIATSLDTLIQRVDSGLDGRAKALNETLAARTLDIAKVLGEGGREVAQVLEARVTEVDQILAARSTAVSEMLSAKVEEVNQVLGGRAAEISETFSARAHEINQALGGRATEITETLSAKAEEVNQVLGGRAIEIAETLDGRISRFEEQVVGRLDSVSTELDARGRALTDNLAARAHEIDTTLAQHTSNLGAALDHESGELAGLLNGRADALKALLGQASIDLDSTLAERIAEIGGVLAGRVNEIGSTLAGRIVELQTALDERGHNLHETLGARSNEIHAVLETKGNDLLAHLGQKQVELATALDQSSTNLQNTLASGAAASIESLIATNERLKGEMAATIGLLADRNASVQQMVDNAGASLAAVENSLATRIHEFESATAGITKEIEDLATNAGTTIGSARALYETIAHQQEALGVAAADLSRSQVELDRTLDERRVGLESLLISVQAQRDEFDGVMTSFAALVDESFRQVEGRARDIGSLLAETSQNTAGMVEQQFNEIRSSLGSERERTAALLRAAYEQANAEIDGIFGQSTARFQAAVAEMRGISREIQRELEATRGELRQNAVSLPQETAEQTAAMRRVVADQIKALNELTDIVARSGRSYDLSDPLASGSARADNVASIRRLEPARPEAMRFSEPLAEASRPEPLRPPRASANPSRPAPPSGAHESGWLSDLLARASREDEQQPARPLASPPRGVQQTEPLETISHDIARMVDHTAVANAWELYRRGESNAFSRQLYIGRGPQTFEEIRRRYRGDVEFRNTVDRYVQEFEKLLADVNRDDRDDTLTRTYLVSETGKVYTMLAHAAGRLG